MPIRNRYSTAEPSSFEIEDYKILVTSHSFPESVDAAFNHRTSGNSANGIGAILEVSSKGGQTWRVHLEYGDGGSFEIIHFPHRPGICFIGDGAAYAVDLSRSKSIEPIRVWPLKGIIEDASSEFIFLYDYTDVVCLDGAGVRWRSGRLSWDGLRSLRINGECLIGEGWSAPDGTWQQFSIQLMSGKVENAAYSDEDDATA